MVRLMAKEAAESDVPIAIFPEGTRTKDGKISRFKTRGLSKLLATRPWTVYVFVVDGYWEAAKFKDFLAGLSHIEGKIEHVNTVEWRDPKADTKPFIDEIRDTMVEGLATMRGERVGARPQQ